MIKFLRMPDSLREKHQSWKSSARYGRQQWLDRSRLSEEIYYNDVEDTGTNFTQSEYKNIMDLLGIPVSLNWIYPVCNQKLAILTQTKPSIRVMSMDGRAKDHAMIIDKMKHGILYTSNASTEIEEATKDMLITGMGCIMATKTVQGQPGMFNIAVVHIPFDEVILDINAKKKSLEDMEGFFLEKVFTVGRAMQIYGGILSELKDENGNPVPIETLTNKTWIENEVTPKQDVSTPQWNTGDRIIAREFYEKVYTTMYTVPDPRTGLNQYFFAENLSDIQQTLLNNKIAEAPGIYIKKSIILGDYCVWQEILPITEYPLKVMFFEWGGRPYRSYGMVHYTKDAQIAFDKFLQIMLVNGIVTNNAGWSAPVGSIPEDKRDAWSRYGLDPTVVKEYVPIDKNGTVLKPEQDRVGQLSNFYPQVLGMMKGYVEFSTGITAVIAGNAEEAKVDVFSSLQQYQNAAMMRIILSTTHVNETLKCLGQILVEYITANITPDTFMFFDEKGNLNELTLAKELANDIKLFRFLTISVPATAMPSQRLSVSTELMKIAQTTSDPIERSLYTQTAMDLTEIREMDDLREKLDVVRKTQSQLQNVNQAYERLQETAKQLENKYINSELENRILKRVAGAEAKIASSYSELETKISLAEEMRKANEEVEANKNKNTNKE